MALTTAQLQAIKADILASPDLSSQPANTDGDFEIARLYNLPAAVEFWVWKTRLGKHEVTDGTSDTGSTFDWAGTGGYIARSQAERDCWRELWNSTLTCNPSAPRVRAAFDDVFSGTGAGAVNNRAHIAAMSRRLTTRLEKLLATGTGTKAQPGTLGYEGTVSYRDIQAARSA